MHCLKKTPEKMIIDSEIATKTALNELKTQMDNINIHSDSLNVEVSTDSVSLDLDDNINNFNFGESSDDDSIQEEIVLRKSGIKQKNHHKKDNSMIFMFSKYENAQKKNRIYKTKIVKLENRLLKLEEREHYKNLDLNNSKLQITELTEKLKQNQLQLKTAKNDLFFSSVFFLSLYSVTFLFFFHSKTSSFMNVFGF